jgi:hypothetical protein
MRVAELTRWPDGTRLVRALDTDTWAHLMSSTDGTQAHDDANVFEIYFEDDCTVEFFMVPTDGRTQWMMQGRFEPLFEPPTAHEEWMVPDRFDGGKSRATKQAVQGRVLGLASLLRSLPGFESSCSNLEKSVMIPPIAGHCEKFLQDVEAVLTSSDSAATLKRFRAMTRENDHRSSALIIWQVRADPTSRSSVTHTRFDAKYDGETWRVVNRVLPMTSSGWKDSLLEAMVEAKVMVLDEAGLEAYRQEHQILPETPPEMEALVLLGIVPPILRLPSSQLEDG